MPTGIFPRPQDAANKVLKLALERHAKGSAPIGRHKLARQLLARPAPPGPGYDPRVADYICAEMAKGRFLGAICEDGGMPTTRAVERWLATEPEFRAAYAVARLRLGDAMAEQAVQIADDARGDVLDTGDGLTPNAANVQRAKLRCDVRRWIAAKLNPAAYGQRIEHTGEVSHRHLVDRPPPESREAWLARRHQELALPAPQPVE